jgi:hypothetical protein
MTLIDDFFSTPIAAGISGLALVSIGLLLNNDRGRRWVLALSLFLYARYILWRGLYTLPTDDLASLVVEGSSISRNSTGSANSASLPINLGH